MNGDLNDKASIFDIDCVDNKQTTSLMKASFNNRI